MRYCSLKLVNQPTKLQMKGAVAVEFALLFVIFFVLFYAIVSYSLLFLLQASFNHAASEGARSAISVDPQSFSNTSSYIEQGVVPIVQETVGNSLSWLPTRARDIVLGESNSNVNVTYLGNVLTVRVIYSNYAENPLIPLLVIPGMGSIFSPSQDIQGTASIRLT